MRAAIYTLALRHYMLEEAVALAKELGYDAVEFTVGYKEAVWDKRSEWHLPLQGIEEAVPEAKKALDRYRMPLACLSTGLSYRDLDQLRRVFWAASELGCPHVRVGTEGYDPEVGFWRQLSKAVEGWREVEKLAREFNVKAVAEIHMGTIIPSASSAYNFVKHFDNKFVGVIFDPGNMAVEGYESWRMGLDILGEYLTHVHVKNPAPVRKDGKWVWDWVALDEGMVNWREVIRVLKEVGYEGALSVEDFSRLPPEISDPRKTEMERARQDLEFLRKALLEAGGRT